MARNEKEYFKVPGSRVAHLRKELGLTQVQIAETLRISQQMAASCEVGHRRIPVSMLPQLSHALKVRIDAMPRGETKSQSKRGPASQLQRSIERISELPKPKQRFVMEMLETVLAQASR